MPQPINETLTEEAATRGEFDLRQAESQAALTHGLAGQEGPAGFGVPLAVFSTRPPWLLLALGLRNFRRRVLS